MPYTCPQCGATRQDDQRCEDRFHADQAREVEQPDYYAVHQFSVPCYMLQHDGYSREGWCRVRALLAEFLAGLPPEHVRRRHGREVDSGRRSWSVTRGEQQPSSADVRWTRTIADVRTDTAEHYCDDVRAWAASILADTEPVARALASSSVARTEGKRGKRSSCRSYP